MTTSIVNDNSFIDINDDFHHIATTKENAQISLTIQVPDSMGGKRVDQIAVALWSDDSRESIKHCGAKPRTNNVM